MCQPDLAVEIVEEKISGVRGFGTEHVCVDWRQLLGWTEECVANAIYVYRNSGDLTSPGRGVKNGTGFQFSGTRVLHSSFVFGGVTG